MPTLKNEISRLRYELTFHRNMHPEAEIAAMHEDLNQFQYVQNLWDKFRAVPVDPVSRRLEGDFRPHAPDGAPSTVERTFPRGTRESEVLEWFETRFCLSVENEFDYEPPAPVTCDGCANEPAEGRVNTVCLRCRRQYPGQDAFENKPDLYAPKNE